MRLLLHGVFRFIGVSRQSHSRRSQSSWKICHWMFLLPVKIAAVSCPLSSTLLLLQAHLSACGRQCAVVHYMMALRRPCILTADCVGCCCCCCLCNVSDALSSSIQEAAMRAGGFAALSASLALEELSGNTLAGGLHRGLMLQVQT
jgi:hypothetical protein